MSVCCLWDAILICKILVDPASLKHCTAVALPLLMCCYHLSESVGPLTIAVLVFYDTYMSDIVSCSNIESIQWAL